MKRYLTILCLSLLAICVVSGLGAYLLKEADTPTETTAESAGNETTCETDTNQTEKDVTDDMITETLPETEAMVPAPTLELSDLACAQVFVYDIDADVFLFEKGTDRPIVPASITKLLTALCALHYMPADELITPGDELNLVKPDSSIAYVRSNHTLTLSMLIEGMMLPSGNDAAHVVAAAVARYVTGDPKMSGQAAVDHFVKLMNDYAVSIGCTGTNYIVPDGYAHEDHYTSAHDLVIVGEAAIRNEIIAKYANTTSEKVFYASGHTMTWHNTNQLIHPESDFYSPYVTGLKTGSLAENYCVLVSAEIGGKTYLLGLFKAPVEAGRYEDAHKIINALLALGV